jgi:hypothetical protein
MPSGTIWGKFSAKSTSIARPYITWSYTQDTAGNTSTIDCNLYFVRYDGYRVWNNDPQPFTIRIDGTNYTESHSYDFGSSSSADYIFDEQKTITHDSDGEKSITISASGNTNNYALGSISLSGTIRLNTIARASDFTAFALADQNLAVSQANTVTYTLDRKSSSFTHYMTLKAGSSTIKTWWDSGTGNRTQSLSASEINSIINKCPNDEGISLYLTMQTKSGSSNIGSSQTRGDWVGLESSVAPSASSLSVSIAGSGRDKTINKYIQDISKVTASFSRSAGYGASISSSKIVVRRASDNANSQTITSNSGTTGNPVSLSGAYEIIATVTDSRGRSDSVSTTISVEAYSAPSISTFSTRRSASVSTTVTATINSSWSPLGTSNPANVTVKGVNNAGTVQTLYTLNDSTATGLNTTQNYTSQLDTSSYTYTITITDSFGKKAEASSTIGTSFMEFCISKGLGVGIGKVHERGSLDIKGEVFLEGTIHMPQNSYRSTTNGGGLDANNGDIYGLNGIWFGASGGDLANNDGEGLLFPRSSTPSDSREASEWDNFRLTNGTGFLNGVEVFTSDNPVLWDGAYYMKGDQTVTPTKSISDCPNGWILAWGAYDSAQGGDLNHNLDFTHIPKWRVSDIPGGGGIGIVLRDGTTGFCTKYFYVTNTDINGHDSNVTSPNDRRVLTAVWSY